MRLLSLGASVSNSDLTQSKKKKASTKKGALSNQNTKLLALAEQVAHFGSWEWDITKPRAVWSPELFRIFGIEPKAEGLTLEEYRSFIHPDDLDEMTRRMQSGFVNAGLNQTSEIDYRIICPDGAIRIIHSQRQVREVTKDGKLKVIVVLIKT